MGRQKKYKTEEERKAAHREACRRSMKKDPERAKELNREKSRRYRKNHPDKIAERNKQYNKTPFGRASYLLAGYKRSDKNAGRGECTLTAQWIIDNIFTQKCAHCDKTGWDVIGCNRLDNS